METILQDLRYGARLLLKNPGFTTVAVLMLALGIGANTALFSVINAVLLRPLPFYQPDRLATLWESSPGRGVEQQAVSPPTFKDWQAQSSAFEEMAYWTGSMDFNLVTRDGPEKVRASFPSANLFHILHVEPYLGRAFLPEDDVKEGPLTAVISYKLWRARFGADPHVLGQTLTADTFGRRTYTIVGVMPERFQFPVDTELWLASGWNGLPQDRRGGHWLNTLVRLKPGVTIEQARSQMNVIQSRIAQEHPDNSLGTGVSIVPLLRQTVGRSVRSALLVLWGVVGGVLLIACANVANLMLARTAYRQKEVALRLALGAPRWRVMRQFLAESLLVGLLGGAGGIILGYWGVKVVPGFSPANIPRLSEVSLDGTVLCFTLGAAVVTGLIAGLAPAWQCSRPDVNEALKHGSPAASVGLPAARLRSALVVGEVALATVLLIGAGLMLQSFAKLLAAQRGFRAEHVVTAELDFSVSGFSTWVRATDTRPQVRLKELLDDIRQLPGVQAAGTSYRFLRRDNNPPVNWSFTIFGRPPLSEAQRPNAEHNAISPGYLRALGVPLLRGRDLTDDDTLEHPGVALVNESFVRQFFPNEEPLGQHITMVANPGPLDAKDNWGVPVWYEVVGVVGDIKSLSTQPAAMPEVYRSYWQWPMQSPTLFVRVTGDAGALAAAIRRETKSIIPSLPTPKIRLLTDWIGESLAQPRFQAEMLAFFGGLALLLSACGVYGLMAYSVTQRQREIGVRMALGARPRNVLALVIGQGMKLAVAGAVIGSAAALALTRVVRNLLYGVTPTDPLSFAAVCLILILVALIACFLPALRATKLDPTVALRSE